MRVRISANAPLSPVKAWFLVHPESTPTVSSFKVILSTAILAFRGLSLHLSIDGFDLLDDSEISVLRDGDLICVDATPRLYAGRAVAQRPESEISRKRKRPVSSSSSSSSASETESEPESETSDSESESDSQDSSRPATPSLRKVEPPKAHVSATSSIQPNPLVVQPSAFVPPGYGKPQTRSRNLRRRLKRMHEHEVAGMPVGGPVSGANAVPAGKNGQAEATVHEDGQDAHTCPTLLSLSLRNKNKAKNFKSLMNKPLPPKIVFGDQEGDTCGTPAPDSLGVSKRQVLPRLIPPSSRPSLPPNMFVTSVDVEAGLVRENRKSKMRIEYGDGLEGEAVDVSVEMGVDIDRLELIADKQWATLEKFTREKQVKPGTIVGYKGLGINPVTHTPEELVTVASVVSCAGEVVIRRLRAVSFSGPVDGPDEAERYTWDDLCDWRIIH